jgi:hypothetical protein
MVVSGGALKLLTFPQHPRLSVHPDSTAFPPAGTVAVQERSFKGQDGFWGEVQATYQTAWDGEEESGDGAKAWH